MGETLVRRVQDGDRDAFEALIVENHRRLFVLAHGILRDPHAAEDATQQAFIDIWRKIGSLREPAAFEAWSYRVLVRACYREARKRRAAMGALQPLDGDIASGFDALGTVVDRDRIERAFTRLSVDQRTVVAMRFLLDMEPEQIAETLDIPRPTVYSRLGRALKAMRAALEADERGTGWRLDEREAAP
jgi:RNA polymerase sigma-70 factor (ECF subfamily)